jgi:hypothetical protein
MQHSRSAGLIVLYHDWGPADSLDEPEETQHGEEGLVQHLALALAGGDAQVVLYDQELVLACTVNLLVAQNVEDLQCELYGVSVRQTIHRQFESVVVQTSQRHFPAQDIVCIESAANCHRGHRVHVAVSSTQFQVTL